MSSFSEEEIQVKLLLENRRVDDSFALSHKTNTLKNIIEDLRDPKQFFLAFLLDLQHLILYSLLH